MTTQTKLSNPTEIVQEPMVKRYFSQALVAIASLIIGLLLGIFVTNLTTTATEVGMQPVAERAAPTYSRGPTLAEYTAAIAENKASVQRAIEAETARYSSMAKFYLTEDEVNTQRAIEAEAARYNSLADFYGAEDGANSLAWPSRPMQFHIAEKAVMPITENALAEYYQSEWGRTLSTVLPIAENGADADRDTGLMEFSTVVNEAGVQRHDREYGLAAFSTIPNESSPQPVIKADADQDIGLMEFLAVPNETRSQHPKAGTLLELHNK